MALDYGSLSVMSVGGVSFLGDFENASIDPDNTTQRYDGNNMDGEGYQVTKSGFRFRASLFSTKGVGPDRVSHLDLTALSLGGVSVLSEFSSLSFRGTFNQRDKPNGGSLWRVRQNVKKHYTAELEIAMPDVNTSIAPFPDSFSATLANRNKVLSFVLNGETITLPMLMEGVPVSFEREGIQMYRINLVGRSPVAATAYPTAPAASDSLLRAAFNDWKTSLAMLFTSHASEGYSCNASVIFSSFGINIRDNELVTTEYEFASTGTVTSASN